MLHARSRSRTARRGRRRSRVVTGGPAEPGSAERRLRGTIRQERDTTPRAHPMLSLPACTSPPRAERGCEPCGRGDRGRFGSHGGETFAQLLAGKRFDDLAVQSNRRGGAAWLRPHRVVRRVGSRQDAEGPRRRKTPRTQRKARLEPSISDGPLGGASFPRGQRRSTETWTANSGFATATVPYSGPRALNPCTSSLRRPWCPPPPPHPRRGSR
jgi:hypothetical protein